MANTINFILTNAALELIPKIINGKTLNFTRMAVGDGFSYDENVAKGFTTLVNEVLNLEITKKEIENSSTVKITSAFTSSDVQKEFYYREVGLFALDPDTGKEILYAYGNRNDAAELITPNGSSSVAKRLIFSVSVGNSANVIVNINSDIYDKADKNLANTGMITNCLLEVPHNIKLELTNGVLTLKAGSKVCFPNGFETDGVTKRFDEVIVNEDISLSDSWGLPNGKQGIFYIDNANGYHYYDLSLIFSGSVAPASEINAVWYDTANNKILETRDGGVTWEKQGCFPLCLFTSNGTNIASVDQVFNGMGYIGSIIWVDKGVKGLIPNGRNADGTLNNIEYTTKNLSIFAATNWDYNDINFFVNTEGQLGHNYLYESEEIIQNVDVKTYVPSKNMIYWKDGTTYKEFYIGKGTILDTKITSLKPYTTFKAVDKSNDKAWLSGLAMPSEKYIDLELDKSGKTYKARANGYFAIRKVAGIANANITFIVRNMADTDGIYRTIVRSTIETEEIAYIIPVLKGQSVIISYNATGKTEYFRFIYAQGEVI